MISGHIGGVPVEELAPFAPAAGTAVVAYVGSRLAAARAQREAARSDSRRSNRSPANGTSAGASSRCA